VVIGDIPTGKRDLYINLQSDADLDIQLFDVDDATFKEGRAVIAYATCNQNVSTLPTY
jgi:hypothetical protein